LECSDFKAAILSGLPELVRIDARRTAKLVHVGLLGVGVSDVVHSVSLSDDSLYEFLHGVFEYRAEGAAVRDGGDDLSQGEGGASWDVEMDSTDGVEV